MGRRTRKGTAGRACGAYVVLIAASLLGGDSCTTDVDEGRLDNGFGGGTGNGGGATGGTGTGGSPGDGGPGGADGKAGSGTGGGPAGAAGKDGGGAGGGTGGAAGSAGDAGTPDGAAAGSGGGCGACACPKADCNGDPTDGCETDLTVDPKNCGVCGKVCADPPVGSPVCKAGVCSSWTCQVGRGDCNGSSGDACEVNLQTDAKNCGWCSHACAFPHAGASCSSGSCAIGSCDVGWLNCDGEAGNGCEIDGKNDPAHCSKCTMQCTVTAPNTQPKCVWAPPQKCYDVINCCSWACKSGFADCNGSPGDGCEVNVTSDPKHCGNCATVCPGTVCVGGKCQ